MISHSHPSSPCISCLPSYLSPVSFASSALSLCHSVQARDGSGSTAVVAFVTPLDVVVANAGDSRAVLIMVTSVAGGKGGGSRALEKGKSETASVATSADGAGRCDSIRLEAEAEQKGEEVEEMGKILAALGAMELRDDAGGVQVSRDVAAGGLISTERNGLWRLL